MAAISFSSNSMSAQAPSAHSGITKKGIQCLIRDKKWDQVKEALYSPNLDQQTLFSLVSGELAHLEDANLFSLGLERIDPAYICSHFLEYCRFLQFVSSSNDTLFHLAVDKLKEIPKLSVENETLENPAYQAVLEKLVESADRERLDVMVKPLDVRKSRQMELSSCLMAKAINMKPPNYEIIRSLYKNNYVLDLNALQELAEILPSFFNKEARMQMLAIFVASTAFQEDKHSKMVRDYAQEQEIDCEYILACFRRFFRNSHCHLFFVLPFSNDQLSSLIAGGGMDHRGTINWLKTAVYTMDLQRMKVVAAALKQRTQPIPEKYRKEMYDFFRGLLTEPLNKQRILRFDTETREKFDKIVTLLAPYFNPPELS